jgi:sugar phosphate isomerase/epimerase
MNSRLAGCTFIRPRQSLEEGLRTAVSFGFKSVDVGIGGLHGHISPIEAAAQPDELGERVRLAAENAGVALNECFTLNFGYPLNDPAAARQQETRAHFAGLAKFAKKAGFASIMLLPGPVHPRLGASRSLDLAVEAFKPLVDLAAKHGIALHVETDCDSCANAPETAAELCRRVPNLKLTLDYSHFISRGYLQEEIEPLHRYAGHVHVRQASRDHIVTRV